MGINLKIKMDYRLKSLEGCLFLFVLKSEKLKQEIMICMNHNLYDFFFMSSTIKVVEEMKARPWPLAINDLLDLPDVGHIFMKP